MPLQDYTTKIDPLKTAGEIEYFLVKSGARSVLKNYTADGHVESLSFTIQVQGKEIPVRCPIDANGVYEELLEEKRNGEISGTITREQAERTAWRLLYHWITAQISFLKSRQRKLSQLFFSDIVAPDGRTLYELFEEKQFLLTSGKE